jgi:hypothetical protein
VHTAKIIVHEVKRNSVCMVFDFFGKGIGQSSEAPHKKLAVDCGVRRRTL